MTTFTIRMSTQYLNASGTPGFDNDGEPVYDPIDGDYSGDVPTGARVRHPMARNVGTVVGISRLFNPSPFTLIREVDPNIFPATSNGFNQGFD